MLLLMKSENTSSWKGGLLKVTEHGEKVHSRLSETERSATFPRLNLHPLFAPISSLSYVSEHNKLSITYVGYAFDPHQGMHSFITTLTIDFLYNVHVHTFVFNDVIILSVMFQKPQ